MRRAASLLLLSACAGRAIGPPPVANDPLAEKSGDLVPGPSAASAFTVAAKRGVLDWPVPAGSELHGGDAFCARVVVDAPRYLSGVLLGGDRPVVTPTELASPHAERQLQCIVLDDWPGLEVLYLVVSDTAVDPVGAVASSGLPQVAGPSESGALPCTSPVRDGLLRRLDPIPETSTRPGIGQQILDRIGVRPKDASGSRYALPAGPGVHVVAFPICHVGGA